MRFQLPQFILYAELTSEESTFNYLFCNMEKCEKRKSSKAYPNPELKLHLYHINWSQNILITYFIAHVKICNCMFYLFYQTKTLGGNDLMLFKCYTHKFDVSVHTKFFSKYCIFREECYIQEFLKQPI